jgi:hypothetical protein
MNALAASRMEAPEAGSAAGAEERNKPGESSKEETT